MLIRPVTPADFTVITALVEAAFGRTFESRLVSDMRAGDSCLPRLMFVAGTYPRFGFQTAGPPGIVPPFEVGDPYFMVAETIPGGLRGVSGEDRHPEAFDES